MPFIRLPVLSAVPIAALVLHRLPALLPSWSVWGLAALVPMAYPFARRRPLGAWVMVLLLSFVCLHHQAQVAVGQRLPAALEGTPMLVQGHVVGDIRAFEAGIRFRFRIERCIDVPQTPGAADQQPACFADRLVALDWYGRDAPTGTLWPGERLQLNLRLKRPRGNLNPQGFDAELWALQNGIAARGYVRKPGKGSVPERGNLRLPGRTTGAGLMVERWRMAARRAMAQALVGASPAARGTLIALVNGEQSAVPAPVWEVFNRTGTSHLMSISGLHVTMFAAIVVLLLRRLQRWRGLGLHRLFMRIPAPSLVWLLGVGAAFAYSVFSGWGIPAQRTCWMLLVAGAGVIIGRSTATGHVLAAAAALVTMLDPWAPTASGFWLSFGIVAALMLDVAAIRARDPWWRQAGRAQWAATVVMLPLGAVWFGSFPLLGPLANAVAIPLISAVIAPGALVGALLSLGWPAAGQAVLMALAWGVEALLWVLQWLSDWPWAIQLTGNPSLLILVLVCLGGWLVLTPAEPVARPVALGLFLPLLLIVPRPVPVPGWRATMLDVGQGTSVLIETAHHALLYDTGPGAGADSGAGDRVVAPLLRSLRQARLDRLVISHEDRDHAGGAAGLLQRFKVGQWMSSLPATHALRLLPYAHQPCVRGAEWTWDGVRFEVLHPGPTRMTIRPLPSNARSCVLRVSGPGGSLLLTGDIELAQEAMLVDSLGNAGLGADVLLVPHHGSKTSSGDALLQAVAPAMAIVQAGYRNRFRHPAGVVTARYAAHGVPLLRTDRDGAITLTFRANQPVAVALARADDRRYWRLPFD